MATRAPATLPAATVARATPAPVPAPAADAGTAGGTDGVAAPGVVPGTAATGDASDLRPADPARWLRGAQLTDADGIAAFTTIWPGWYRGRTVHVHVVVHLGSERVLTTQLMFDDTLNDAVLAGPGYVDRGPRDTRNDADAIFRPALLTSTVADGDGYLSTATLTAFTGG
jgi:hypothetical protein